MSKHKQYFYVILLIYSNIYFITSKDIAKPYVTDTTVNKTSNSNNNIIPSEGGGKIIVEHVSSSSSTPASTIEKSNTNGTTTISTLTSTQANKPKIIESKVETTNTSTSTTTTTTTTTESVKPVSEQEEIVGDSKVKPRKGVTFSEPIPISTKTTTKADTLIINSTTTTTTTTTTKKPTTKVFIPHKPRLTIADDDDVPPAKSPPKLFVNGKEILPKNHTNSPPKLITDNDPIYISRRTEKGPDYVLPIVLTILSVPLLAIIFTVVYKRGSEWWHHRHYRRMDFLIDGMYNN